ncbi:M20 family metallopeptidase [Siminovitchia sediminis]|uniref:M20 family metallopeptidase n=1 Tax=Siminovitchia sediminis TaxID=1274353 RepID=A0ABW4KMJ7_9BACI
MIREAFKLIDQNEVIKVVKDLVSINSVMPPHNVEKEIGNYVLDYMKSKGVESEIQQVAPERFNVICKLKGEKKNPAIIFTGHMDTVPVSEDETKLWNTDPFRGEIINGNLYGRGSTDMKGGLGSAMVALGTLSEHGIVPPNDIILVATVDEETIMLGSKKLINTHFIKNAKKMVVCEPTNLELHPVCRGRTWAEIKLKGKTAHASVPKEGINAIDKAVTFINRLNEYKIPHDKHELLGNSFWNVTEIKGGLGPAIIPDECTITLDVRLVPGQTSQDIWLQVGKILDELREEVQDFDSSIEIIETRDPWETPVNDSIVTTMEKSMKNIDLPILYGGFLGTTDGTELRKSGTGIDTVIFGPGRVELAHKENEYVSIHQLVEAAKVYIETMVSFEE